MKKQERLEKKKRKAIALVNMLQINKNDRKSKKVIEIATDSGHSSNSDEKIEDTIELVSQ